MNRPIAALMLLLALLLQPAGVSAGDVPPLDALVGRISSSLGGADGGARVLEAAEAYDLVFQRTVKDSHSNNELTADHRLVWIDKGSRRRLDIRILAGEGKSSAAVLDGAAAWLVVDGAAHEAAPDAVRSQLTEFDPMRLYSVPFALGAEGRQILGAASLSAAEKDGDRFVLIGRDESGAETSRLVVDASTYRPVMVQFRSSSGDVEYRYSAYTEVQTGLVVPFEREFWRNGTRISRTSVTRFKLKAPGDAAELFDRANSTLGPIPGVKASGKRE